MDQQHYESEIKSGGHGEKFQRDIALSLLLRMRKCSSTTRMAYEMKMADKFDDSVLIDDTNEEIHLIQAKHADTSDGNVKYVDLDALFPTGKNSKRNGDFDLCKYAKSYLSVNQSIEPKLYKKMFYIFTNKDLKQTDNDWVKIEEREVNETLRFPDSSARNLKLIPTEKAINEMINYLNKDIIVIKDAIKEFFDRGIISKIITDYCTPLKDVITIDQKRCTFASDFNSENKIPSVAMLYTLLQSDQVDMKKEVTVSNNFLVKDSRNKHLPPYVSNVEIVAFFHDFTLSVRQPHDLRPIIVNELQAWMKTWIRPDILCQLRKKELEQVYLDLETYFDQCNEPVIANRKRFLEKQDIENCFAEIKRDIQTVVLKHIMAEADEWQKTYINRQLKYEEAALEPIKVMADTIEKADIVKETNDVSTDNVQKLLSNGKMKDTKRNNAVVRQISDTKFFEELRGTFKNHQHILLVAEPGMGKTSLLQFLTFEVQKQNDIAVFLVYFNALRKELNKIEEVANLNDVRGILSAVLSEENCNLILTAPEMINDKGNSIILALDGFDEIHSKYTVKVLRLIELLSEKKSIQFIISSRIHVQQLLESKFDVKLISLVPFSELDQIQYLKKIWIKEIVDEKAVENFSKLLFKKMHSSIASNLNQVSGLPLMMRMLAEIYSDRFQQFISAGSTENSEQFDLSEDRLNIVQLFERFINKCLHNKFVETFKPTVDINDDAFNPIIDVYILEHQLLAIKLLDIKELRDLFRKPYYKKRYDLFKRRCETDSEKSMLVKVVNNDVQFCHLSFGEYFVATYLSDHISELESVLLYKVLSQHEVIRKLTLIKLAENETYSEILKGLFGVDCVVALWACESGSFKLVSSLKENFESFSVGQLNKMLKVSAERGYLEVCAFLIEFNADLDKCTALHSAVANGHVNVFQLLLKCKVDVNGQNSNGRTPLHTAAWYGHLSLVKLLIDNNADPNIMDEDEWTALHFACDSGNVETVNFLINTLGMNTSSRSIKGKTPLHIAAKGGHASVAILLVQNNSDANDVDEDKWTALHYACRNGNVETVQFLLTLCMNTSPRSTKDLTPLHVAAWKGHKNVVKLLVEHKADPNEVDKDNWTALYFACRYGHVETVQFLIDLGMNTSFQANDGKTPLHIAASKGHVDVMKLLIENHSDPNVMDKDKWTALHFACRNGNVETVQLLLTVGMNTSSRPMNVLTPLHIAAWNGHKSVVKLLIEHNADPNEVDDDKWTALHFACQCGHVETVQFLIDLGMNTSFQANDGKTPLHIAASKGHVDVMKLLIANEADPNEVDENEWTALHFASQNGDLEAVKFLISIGMNTSSRTTDDKTPLHIAEEHGRARVVELLKGNPSPIKYVRSTFGTFCARDQSSFSRMSPNYSGDNFEVDI